MKKLIFSLLLTGSFIATSSNLFGICPEGWEQRPSNTYQLPDGTFVTNCPALSTPNGVCCVPKVPNQ